MEERESEGEGNREIEGGSGREINIDGAKGEGERNSIQFGMSTNLVRELCVQYVRGKEDKGNDNGMMRSIEEKDVEKKTSKNVEEEGKGNKEHLPAFFQEKSVRNRRNGKVNEMSYAENNNPCSISKENKSLERSRTYVSSLRGQ